MAPVARVLPCPKRHPRAGYFGQEVFDALAAQLGYALKQADGYRRLCQHGRQQAALVRGGGQGSARA
ncbi:hypothetical protein AXW84_00880 [Hymenobacter sp. PAMC 26628]|nr:hypothetical protein AXW84_00880 [Hymenobacter sp. PAMC 26628]